MGAFGRWREGRSWTLLVPAPSLADPATFYFATGTILCNLFPFLPTSQYLTNAASLPPLPLPNPFSRFPTSTLNIGQTQHACTILPNLLRQIQNTVSKSQKLRSLLEREDLNVEYLWKCFYMFTLHFYGRCISSSALFWTDTAFQDTDNRMWRRFLRLTAVSSLPPSARYNKRKLHLVNHTWSFTRPLVFSIHSQWSAERLAWVNLPYP